MKGDAGPFDYPAECDKLIVDPTKYREALFDVAAILQTVDRAHTLGPIHALALAARIMQSAFAKLPTEAELAARQTGIDALQGLGV
jgi:hypothetical protein